MDVATDSWQLVGTLTDTEQVIQNAGDVRIAWVAASAQPGAGAITLDSDEHGVLKPGMDPMTFPLTATLGIYVRALGPRNGRLYVYTTT
jgi:hypothetical protein